jgi:hypothetical protein
MRRRAVDVQGAHCVTNKGKKLEPPLRLDMNFFESLERFVHTDPKEVEESIERSKTKVPPQDGAPRRRGRSKEHQVRSAGPQKRKPSIP